MKNLVFLILIYAFNLTIMSAQNEDAIKGLNENKDAEIIKYKLALKYKVNTFYNIKITETTKVIRTYPDSTRREYSRDIIYYTTTSILESPTKGFQPINVVIDSLNYKFTEGDVIFDFNSVDLSGKALKFKDLNYKTVSLGREYKLIYSPYGEVAKMESEEIVNDLKYTKEKGKGYLSDVEMFIWTNGLSTKHLSYLGDIQKIVFPYDRIAKDSIWLSPVNLEMNGYNYHDTLKMKIKDYNAGYYYLEGQSSSLNHVNENILSYEIVDLVNIKNTKGSGKLNMTLKANGFIEKTELNYELDSKIEVGNQYINEKIQSNVSWEVTGTFKL